ncbi:hypothetical protein ACA910_007478 [Epithemia clementina (nom. ined.)]
MRSNQCHYWITWTKSCSIVVTLLLLLLSVAISGVSASPSVLQSPNNSYNNDESSNKIEPQHPKFEQRQTLLSSPAGLARQVVTPSNINIHHNNKNSISNNNNNNNKKKENAVRGLLSLAERRSKHDLSSRRQQRRAKKGSSDTELDTDEKSKKGGSSNDPSDDDDDDDDDDNHGGDALQGSSFIYVQDQLANTVTQVSRSEGQEYSSQIGAFTPDLFCTSAMCAGLGRAELIGESPERDDEDYLEVVISGPITGDVFPPSGGTPTQVAAPTSFTFFCPSSLQELKVFEIVDCECFSSDAGSCVEENFALTPAAATTTAVVLNPFTLYYTGTGASACTTGFRAHVIFECRD